MSLELYGFVLVGAVWLYLARDYSRKLREITAQFEKAVSEGMAGTEAIVNAAIEERKRSEMLVNQLKFELKECIAMCGALHKENSRLSEENLRMAEKLIKLKGGE
jgi:hypothetical protein